LESNEKLIERQFIHSPSNFAPSLSSQGKVRDFCQKNQPLLELKPVRQKPNKVTDPDEPSSGFDIQLDSSQTGFMHKRIELEKCYRLLNHGPTVLVSSAHHGKKNVMAAAWSMPLDFSPPKVTVVIEESSFTRELVDASGTFALNIPVRSMAQLTLDVGSASGREIDKFNDYCIETFQSSLIEAPLISGCAGWLECKVISEPHIQKTYDLFIGEVIAAWADPRAFENGRWKNAPPDLHTLHYIAGGSFFIASETLEMEKDPS